MEAGHDLFGLWTARVTFGRIGCAGRGLSKLYQTKAVARAYVRGGFRRRQTSIRRFGVPYRPVAASSVTTPLLEITGVIALSAALSPNQLAFCYG